MGEPFLHRLRVRWSECDLQGVVFYPQYLAYLDHTVTELWREAIGPYTQMIPKHGVDMVVAEAGMSYRASARFDDELEIAATVTRLGSTSVTTAFTIERLPDGALLTEGRLRHVFVDPDNSGKREMPPAIRAALKRFAAGADAAEAAGT
jgi:acyl-CoA thioester hydrolase